jgi:hypothetical protein
MGIDWDAFENAAVKGATRDLQLYAKEHSKDEFYGAIFWCNPPEIFIYMPTEQVLRKEAEEIYSLYTEHNQTDKSVEELMQELKWGVTQCMASDYIEWDDYEQQIVRLDDAIADFRRRHPQYQITHSP